MQLRPIPARVRFGIGDAFIALLLAAALYFGVRLALGSPSALAGPEITLAPSVLPYYGLRSLLRMLAAYLLSLAFTLVYGYTAAHSRRAEAILIPALDVLQSVPILSFLPVVLLAMIALFPETVGVELAAVILIFTSQAWNMTFAFYHSLITIPKEMREAASVFRLSRWLQFRAIELPFATIGLVWNSMMSWAGGWFFLMAAEQFQLGDRDFRLPGIGSYLKTAAEQGDLSALLLGLATLVVLILLLDQFVWRPLIAWSDKFNLQTVEEAYPPRSWVLDILSRSTLVDWLSARVLYPLSDRLDTMLSRAEARPRGEWVGERVWRAMGALALVALVVVAVYGGALAIAYISSVSLSEWLTILAAAAATFLRVVAALAIALAWTLPVGVAIGTNHRLANRMIPIVQVAASVPATALFPVLLLLLIGLAGGLNLAAVLLMLLGTQWYLLFNIIAGAMAIPTDLDYTTRSLGISGLERWRSYILPAVFPYLVTGMITATGGAWNASIVAEYVLFAGRTYETLGLGALIASSSEAAQFDLLLASTVTMVAIVVLLNRLLWRRLYRLAEDRFHLE